MTAAVHQLIIPGKCALAEQTWEEVGCKIRALRTLVFIRTEEARKRIGLIWLPSTESDFYGGPLMHMRLATGIVIAKGPRADVEIGDRVVFQRMYFSRWKTMKDRTLVGWLEASQITGIADSGVEFSPFITKPGGPRQPTEWPM